MLYLNEYSGRADQSAWPSCFLVVYQQVVPEEAGAGTRWSVVETSMRAVEVVVAEPER